MSTAIAGGLILIIGALPHLWLETRVEEVAIVVGGAE